MPRTDCCSSQPLPEPWGAFLADSAWQRTVDKKRWCRRSQQNAFPSCYNLQITFGLFVPAADMRVKLGITFKIFCQEIIYVCNTWHNHGTNLCIYPVIEDSFLVFARKCILQTYRLLLQAFINKVYHCELCTDHHKGSSGSFLTLTVAQFSSVWSCACKSRLVHL